MAKNLNEFLEPLKSLTISSLDDKGHPFSSYAPFVKYNNKYYVYLSLMAKHSSNLTENKIASIFFCEDEQDCKNIFAKKRVSIQCETLKLEQDTQEEQKILNEFRVKFGKDMVDMLKKWVIFIYLNLHHFMEKLYLDLDKRITLVEKTLKSLCKEQLHLQMDMEVNSIFFLLILHYTYMDNIPCFKI